MSITWGVVIADVNVAVAVAVVVVDVDVVVVVGVFAVLSSSLRTA